MGEKMLSPSPNLEIAATSDAMQELRGLPVPAGDEAALQDIYCNVDQLLSDITDLKASVRDRDQAKAVTLQANVTAYTTVCGS